MIGEFQLRVCDEMPQLMTPQSDVFYNIKGLPHTELRDSGLCWQNFAWRGHRKYDTIFLRKTENSNTAQTDRGTQGSMPRPPVVLAWAICLRAAMCLYLLHA